VERADEGCESVRDQPKGVYIEREMGGKWV
jgi:hypothetical protein